MTSNPVYSFCPTEYEYEIVNLDGSAIDSNIFGYDPALKQLSVESSDPTYLGQSPISLLLKVKYIGYDYNGQLPFDVVLKNPCLEDATLSQTP